MCIGGQNGVSPISLAMDAAAVASGNPEALLAAAASTAGNYIQTKNNNDNLQREYNARNAVMQQGVEEQNANTKQAQGILNNTISKFGASDQQQTLGDLINNRTSTIGANTALPSSFVDPTSNANAPKVVQNSLADKMSKAAAFSNQQAGALGALGGQEDLLNQNQQNIASSGANIGTVGAIAKEQARANLIEQQSAANNARKGPSIFGQGLSDVGTVLGLDSFTGGNGLNYFTGANTPTAGTTNLVNQFRQQQAIPTVANGDYYGAGV